MRIEDQSEVVFETWIFSKDKSFCLDAYLTPTTPSGTIEDRHVRCNVR